MTDDDINNIKSLRRDGLSYKEISNQTSWSKATVSRVLNGLYD
ncbi:MAG: helix-turn-helix domain-containing protein [Clostridioides difficile]